MRKIFAISLVLASSMADAACNEVIVNGVSKWVCDSTPPVAQPPIYPAPGGTTRQSGYTPLPPPILPAPGGITRESAYGPPSGNVPVCKYVYINNVLQQVCR